MLMHNPTVGTFAGSIVEPIDVLTMDLRIPMGDILRIPLEDILLTPMGGMEWAMEDIIVHPISADTNTVVGTMGVLTASATGVRL